MKESLVPTSSNDILALLCPSTLEKGRKHRIPPLPLRERALSWTFRDSFLITGTLRNRWREGG